ncbi:hypothetical protein HYV82_03550 [Candidatus Woesearchaeota archaeon]|nr:hypothetical protein [Candidatus Woesearchaeota archaeon]
MANVKQLVALLVAVMVFAVPAIAAEQSVQAEGQAVPSAHAGSQAGVQASAGASASETAKAGKGLRLRMVGEAFGDFVFNVRSVLAFDKKAKLELLKERNEKLRERQKAWLELKAGLLGNFSNSSMSSGEKKEAIKAFQEEHRAIIREHLKATAQLRKLQLKAKAEGDAELEREADESAEAIERSEVAHGLNLEGELGSLIRLEAKGEGNGGLTEEEAKEMVEKDMRFKASNVSTEARGNTTYYVVTGSRTESAGAYELEKSYEVRVEAETGVVTSVEMGTRIVARPGENGAGASTVASAGSGNADSSGGVRVRASGEAGAGASGGVGAAASGGVGVGLG